MQPNLKEILSRQLLLLVHPDIIFEKASNDLDVINNYIKDIEKHSRHFDYIIVHLFYSPAMYAEKGYGKYVGMQPETEDLFRNFIDRLRENADVVMYDKNYSASFQDKLPSYLIDNPGTKIFLAGGYRNLCVKETEKMMMGKLRDIIEETEATISCYDPLIIETRY